MIHKEKRIGTWGKNIKYIKKSKSRDKSIFYYYEKINHSFSF